MIWKKRATNLLDRITARYRFYAAQRQFHKIRLAQPQNVPEMSGLTSSGNNFTPRINNLIKFCPKCA